jgi:hypothetical protein
VVQVEVQLRVESVALGADTLVGVRTKPTECAENP